MIKKKTVCCHSVSSKALTVKEYKYQKGTSKCAVPEHVNYIAWNIIMEGED